MVDLTRSRLPGLLRSGTFRSASIPKLTRKIGAVTSTMTCHAFVTAIRVPLCLVVIAASLLVAGPMAQGPGAQKPIVGGPERQHHRRSRGRSCKRSIPPMGE